jgi:hypothetical protein
MGLVEDAFEHSLPGVVIGALATAVLLPLVGGVTAVQADRPNNGRRRANPLMKAAVRGYVTLTDRVKEMTAEAREQLQDLAAEVRDERRRLAEEAAAPEPEQPSPSPGQA